MPFSVRARVEGQPIPGDPRFFPGTVIEEHAPAAGGAALYSVLFIGVPNSSGAALVLEESQLRPLSLPPNAIAFIDLKPGLKISAKYTGDGCFYPAKVDDVTSESTIRVTFLEYGNTEIVPLEYISRGGVAAPGLAKAIPAAAPAGVAGGGEAAGDDDDGDEDKGFYAGLVIPDHLRSLPTDSPEDRLRKRKRVKALKLAYKQRATEAAGEKRKGSWQSFLADKSRKAPAGFMASAAVPRAGPPGVPATVAALSGAKTARPTWGTPLDHAASAAAEAEAEGPTGPFKRAR